MLQTSPWPGARPQDRPRRSLGSLPGSCPDGSYASTSSSLASTQRGQGQRRIWLSVSSCTWTGPRGLSATASPRSMACARQIGHWSPSGVPIRTWNLLFGPLASFIMTCSIPRECTPRPCGARMKNPHGRGCRWMEPRNEFLRLPIGSLLAPGTTSTGMRSIDPSGRTRSAGSRHGREGRIPRPLAERPGHLLVRPVPPFAPKQDEAVRTHRRTGAVDAAPGALPGDPADGTHFVADPRHFPAGHGKHLPVVLGKNFEIHLAVPFEQPERPLLHYILLLPWERQTVMTAPPSRKRPGPNTATKIAPPQMVGGQGTRREMKRCSGAHRLREWGT